jgi:8-hydroxy-5-deazaflavin:NADPH oxidoreductase
MKIGIIGVGAIGGSLARKLSAAGHEVRIANSKGVEGVRAIAEQTGSIAADVRGAVEGAEAVIISVPLPAVANLPKDLFDGVPASVPVIDTCNYYPGIRDPQIAELDAGKVESVWVSEQLGRPVTKAFNNLISHTVAELGRPKGAPDRIAMAVAGDDAQAKAVAISLADDTGFDAVDAGPLAESWRMQPSTPVYCCDWNAAETRRALASAKPGEAPIKRARIGEFYGKLPPNPTHADIIAAMRKENATS